ncbi:MAG: hypothetical protein DI570_19530 [Phenylobacterium zucineum]|nr:MAG: hypothetical protein DI570_19530 [Phenylobacterium zucineum]
MCGAALAWAGAAAAAEPGSPLEAIAAGKPILELRTRYATVEQTHTRVLTDDAEALTVRARVGWETAAWRGFRGLIEAEAVGAPIERYAVNAPGAATPPLNGAAKARYPVENDPEVFELNRLQLAWSSGKAFQATLGRQRITFDDQRFVGNVGWRQDEQTFDALRLDGSWGAVKASYAYVIQANRILGEKRDWDSDSHLAKVDWQATPQLKLAAFAYVLDFANSPANSSVTTGAKASGQAKAGAVAVAYNATYARQRDYRRNTADYALDYWGGDVAATWGVYTLKASFESLEGDGARSFTTPLATNHAFQGWADAFVQPAGANQGFADGIEDANLALVVRPNWRWGTVGKAELLVRYHDFDGQRTGADLGHEWDAQIQAQLRPGLTAAVKYADFERARRVPAGAASPPASRTKFWFSLEYRL